MSTYNESVDVAHAATGGSVAHPTLPAGATINGQLNNFVDPVFGLTTDFDYYEFLLGTGPGQIAPGSFLTVTFTPGAN